MHNPLKLLCAAVILLPTMANAGDIAPREGWRVIQTDLAHAQLLDRLLEAVPAEKMGVVTEAGPTAVARERGIEIPENRVVGVFNNDYAVRILAMSTAAMIEAPLRFYVTENDDGNATLSWKTPSFVFAPYLDEGGDELAVIAEEIDARFEAIASHATGE